MNSILLLVEDEQTILDTVGWALEDEGFLIKAISNGPDAFRFIDEHASEIWAVISDIRLGEGPNGWDVARHAREAKPAMPIVYITGDSSANWLAQGVPKSIIIQKPFVIAQLVAAVAALMSDLSPSPE